MKKSSSDRVDDCRTSKMEAERIVATLAAFWDRGCAPEDTSFKDGFFRWASEIEEEGGFQNFDRSEDGGLWVFRDRELTKEETADVFFLARIQVDISKITCVLAIKAMGSECNSARAWQYACQASNWLGMLMGVVTAAGMQSRLSEAARQLMTSDAAKERANRRWANDPTQRAKNIAKACWDEWQKDPARYRNQPKFASDVLDKVEVNTKGEPVISFNTIIKKYIPEWQSRKEKS
jgi:hypothetical protein